MDSSSGEVLAKRRTYAGLFLVVLATLMFEVLLTRIFSVSMWYHFAFLAISVGMFGMSVGAIVVYLLPSYFTHDRTKNHLALSALLFSVTAVGAFLTHLTIPFAPEMSITGIFSVVLTFAVISVPFIFSGICVCLALTRFPRQISGLYATDLAGASLGSVLLLLVLNVVDGPTAVIVVALLAGLSAVLFAADARHPGLTRAAIVLSLALGAFAAVHTAFVYQQFPLVRLIWVKGGYEQRPLYERWNSFSRVRVWGDPNTPNYPFGWGLSDLLPPSLQQVRQLYMDIDADAFTPLTAFSGNLAELEHLKYDVTNLVHYVRPKSKVLVIGVGGGRDVLSALAFEQESVTGVEINPTILHVRREKYGDFTGHLDRNPKVTFVNDEARSYVARHTGKFDIIQTSLIDTYAATAAGAFVLTENSLYTVEAWQLFLERLTPDGVLTFSRWYWQEPTEVYRLTSLATEALLRMGVKNPRDHLVIVHNRGVATMLVRKRPFDRRDLDTVARVTNSMGFQLVLSPQFAFDPAYAAITSPRERAGFLAASATNITAPTDDNPFFFLTLRLRDIFKPELWDREAKKRHINTMPVVILGVLLITVVGLTGLCIFVPLALTQKASLTGASSLLVFFAAIGFGFMLVEISQMQRLIIFLGHPTYGLSVILVALLLSGGVGSYSTQRVADVGFERSAVARLVILVCVLAVFGVLTPSAMRQFQGATTPVRILVALGVLFPIGMFMGMAFPLGMKLASPRAASLTPWLWGINGATSVCASVVAVIIAMSFGISAAFWTGAACYAVALGSFLRASRRGSSS